MSTIAPGQTLRFVAKNDLKLTPQPAIFYLSLSAKDTLEKEAKVKELTDESSGAEVINKIKQEFAGVVTGWENFGSPFDWDQIDSLLTLNGLWELVYGVLSGNHVSDDEKKN